MAGRNVYSVGTAYLTIAPSFVGVEAAIERQLRKAAASAENTVAAALPKGMAQGAKAARREGAKAGDNFAGAFGANASRLLERAFRSLPEYAPDMNLRKWDKAVKRLRDDVGGLNADILKGDIDDAVLGSAIDNVRGRIRQLQGDAPDLRGFFNLRAAAAEVEQLGDLADEARRRGVQVGQGFGGGFADELRKTVTRMVERLPAVKVDADTSAAMREIAAIRSELVALGDKTIDVDIDAKDAQSQLLGLQSRLRGLAAADVDVDVKVNAAQAAADVDRLTQELRRTDVQAGLTLSRLGYMIAAGSAVGTSIVPAAAAATVAVGALGTAVAGVFAGFGVMALAVGGVGDAVKALEQEQEASTRTALAQANAQHRVQDAVAGLGNAQRSYGEAVVSAGEAQAAAARRVQDAEEAVGQARSAAAAGARDAAERVADAHRDLTSAEQDARRSREDLTEAYRDARRDLEELSVATRRNAVDQEQADISIAKARAELNKVLADKNATELQRREARATFQERVLQLESLKIRGRELAEEQAKANKDGVEGTDRVRSARERVAQTDERVAGAQRSLEKARRDADEQARESAERVRDAEVRVADARREQGRVARQAQQQIAAASESVASAQRNLQQAYVAAGQAGQEAADRTRLAMEQLSPAGQRMAVFIHELKDEYLSLRAAAAEGFLPGAQQAITELLPYLPGLRREIGEIATAMGNMSVQAVRNFKDPTWVEFGQFLDRTLIPSMQDAFTVSHNFAKGAAELWMAITPFNGEVGGGLVDMSERFARWADRLEHTQGYREFLAYVREQGPEVLEVLGQLLSLTVKFVAAAAPVGGVVLDVFQALLGVLNALPTPVLTAFVFAMAAMGAATSLTSSALAILRTRGQLTSTAVAAWTTITDSATSSAKRHAQALELNTRALGLQKEAEDLAAQSTRRQIEATDLAAQAAAKREAADARQAAAVGKSTIAAGLHREALDLDAQATRKAHEATDLAVGSTDRLRVAQELSATAAARTAQATTGVTGAADRYRDATGKAEPATSRLGRAMETAGGLGLGMKSKMGGLVDFLAGPWGVALIGATAAVTYFATQAADHTAEVEGYRSVLSTLADEYNRVKASGDLATSSADATFRALVANDPKMQQLVVTLDGMGVGFDAVAQAATGSAGHMSTVINALDAEAARVRAQMQANFFDIFDNAGREDRIKALMRMKEGFIAQAQAAGLAADAQSRVNTVERDHTVLSRDLIITQGMSIAKWDELKVKYEQNSARIAELTRLTEIWKDGQITATEKTDLLKDAINRQYGEEIRTTEATETFSQKLLNLRDTVQLARDSHIAHATSLDANTRQGLRNRDALQEAAKATRDLYLEDIASNVPMDKATKAHRDRITELKKEARDAGLTKDETARLISKYGELGKIGTVETVLKTKDFKKVYEELRQLQFAQYALAKGMDPKQAEKSWIQLEAQRQGVQPTRDLVPRPEKYGRAEGGQVHGPGGPTADAILGVDARTGAPTSWVSNKEWVHPVDAVDYYTPAAMRAIQQRRIRREDLLSLLPGHARGGQVLPGLARGGQVLPAPFNVDLSKVKIPAMDEVRSKVLAGLGMLTGAGAAPGAVPGTATAGRGWQWQMSALRNVFPGLALFSGYRPGSITSSGNLSWHARDGGRAVDIPPRHDVFNWIYSNFAKGTRELIWLGQANRNIQNGRHYRYSDSLLRAHGTAGMPNAHIHWAFDEGGELQPGYTAAYNGTGRPEKILTESQWSTMSALAHKAMQSGPSKVMNFHYRDTTLTRGKLRAVEAQDEVMERIGRAR